MASNDLINTGERWDEESDHLVSLTWPFPTIVWHGKFPRTFIDPRWPALKSHFVVKSQAGCRAPMDTHCLSRDEKEPIQRKHLSLATWVLKHRPTAYGVHFAWQLPDTVTRPFSCNSSAEKQFWWLQIFQTLYIAIMTLKFQRLSP